jgi:hypothetical protein
VGHNEACRATSRSELIPPGSDNRGGCDRLGAVRTGLRRDRCRRGQTPLSFARLAQALAARLAQALAARLAQALAARLAQARAARLAQARAARLAQALSALLSARLAPAAA